MGKSKTDKVRLTALELSVVWAAGCMAAASGNLRRQYDSGCRTEEICFFDRGKYRPFLASSNAAAVLAS